MSVHDLLKSFEAQIERERKVWEEQWAKDQKRRQSSKTALDAISADSPAFAGQTFHKTLGQFMPHAGMTLRDYFAGQALTGFCSNLLMTDGSWNYRSSSETAYRMADAMITAREATKETRK